MAFMRKVHLISGIVLLIVFAVTGQYMIHAIDLPNTEFDAQRMMYRASHIYLLFAGCVNTLVGCYWTKAQSNNAIAIQWLASALIVFSQLLLLLAFYREPPVIDRDRLLTLVGCVSLLVGVVLTLISQLMDRKSRALKGSV